MANTGTDAEILAQFLDEDNTGDSIATPNQRMQAELRMRRYVETVAGGGNPNRDPSWRRCFIQIMILAANVGTGNVDYFNGKTLRWTDQNAAARTSNMREVLRRITSDPLGTGAADGFPMTIRAYFRSRANTMIAIFKNQPTQAVRHNKMGIPDNYRYLAFDFVDAGVAGLSPEEKTVIDAAKQLSLYRSQKERVYNAAVNYQGGSGTTSAGSIQTNARQITFK